MNKNKFGKFLFDNKVVILFVFLGIGGFLASGQTLSFLLTELFTRIARNLFLVLSLIIPVLAGMGLNFGIVMGAIAAQIAIFLTTHWGFVGITGLGLTVLVATPLAILFGYLVGVLFNHMKGTEMIGGLVLGYFAEGFYQFLFLFVFGGIIPIVNETLMIETGVGVKNTIDLTHTVKYALDNVPMTSVAKVGAVIAVVVILVSAVVKTSKKQAVDFKKVAVQLVAAVVVFALTFVPAVQDIFGQERLLLLDTIEIGCAGVLVFAVLQFVVNKFVFKKEYDWKKTVTYVVVAAVIYALTYIPDVYDATRVVRLPMFTYICIAGVCMFNSALLKTKLGQEMRTVGQSRTVANAAGINVDRTRIIAMILSTVLASWGQLIYLQNIGTFSTYGAHTNTGTFSIAALLVGGASVQKATNKQAILGVVLFHTLFIVAPLAGNRLFGDAAIGEYFRVFVSYGVIAMALAMHAWKTVKKVKEEKK